MKRTLVTCTAGALLVGGAAVVVPTQAHAIELGHHAPSVVTPAVHHATTASAQRTGATTTSKTNSTAKKKTSDTQQVVAAIRASKMLGAVKPSNITVSQVKFAGADHTWAGALVTPKNAQTDPAQVLLKKSGSTWKVRDLGTAFVGCNIAPSGVRNTLGLHGPC
ncbi:hypothetical protein [Flexivirga sp. B27]